MFKFFRKNKESADEETNFWISYADIMAALLLMFILLLTVVIFDYQETLAEKQDEIDALLGVREEIISALQTKFSDTDLSLEIDEQTGAIILPGGVFFDTDSTEITNKGIEFLESFIPQYVGILLGPNFKDYVAQIIIEGHTDDVGSYMYNLELSQNRAFGVVKQIYKEDFTDFKYKETLRDYLTANGRSYSQPIKKDGKINREKSRRVEFKFRLKDTEMINDVKNILGD